MMSYNNLYINKKCQGIAREWQTVLYPEVSLGTLVLYKGLTCLYKLCDAFKQTGVADTCICQVFNSTILSELLELNVWEGVDAFALKIWLYSCCFASVFLWFGHIVWVPKPVYQRLKASGYTTDRGRNDSASSGSFITVSWTWVFITDLKHCVSYLLLMQTCTQKMLHLIVHNFRNRRESPMMQLNLDVRYHHQHVVSQMREHEVVMITAKELCN